VRQMSANQLRQAFLNFFAEKGHRILPGASLVPAKDPTLLLTSAGMVPFKPYFLGLETPEHRRVTTCQRGLRTGDIDHVGKTDRHHTFFEMLGNFSFGDYFKREAITWAWEFVTERLELEKDRLWVSIYIEDDEAFDIWHREVGLPEERIVRLGKKDNFWEIGVGPCGPCSEIYYDRGEAFGCGEPDCRPACDRCERYLEIWNLVFIQYHQDEKGQLTPLKSKGIDTGMGLERTASLLQGVASNFEIDIIRPVVDHIASVAGIPYKSDPDADVSMRVITDHMRGVTFMIFDGILPGNEGRGYVLRRLLRRSVRHAKLLGIEGSFLAGVADRVIDVMRDAYPELEGAREYIRRVVAQEEARFHETLDQGMEILERLAAEVSRSGGTVLPGEDAFRLYDTYGFPLELTEEILAARGLTLDRAGFERAMEAQRQRARAARGEMGYLGDKGQVAYHELDLEVVETPFLGYETLEADGRVVALIARGEKVGRVEEGEAVEVILDRTPFYPEGGGQVADTGVIVSDGGRMVVESVMRVAGGLIVHRGRVVSGVLRVGDEIRAQVDAETRLATARNHTATHLLHKALQEVLGEHAKQAGSLVAPDRLRFDFTHFKPLTRDELAEIERRVNAAILEDLPVTTIITSLAEAQAMGAMALFGEKYGERVRVVKIGEWSIELCGGTHVSSSASLGMFKVVEETGVAAGVRRVEAVTGKGALQFVRAQEETLADASRKLQVAPEQLPQQIDKLLGTVKELEREVNRLKARLAGAFVDSLVSRAQDAGGVKVVAESVDGLDREGLRALGDRLKEALGPAVIVLGSATGGSVQMVAMATPDAVARGIDARSVIRKAAAVVGGGGGGSEQMAQAGGKDPSRLGEALAEARAEILERLQSQEARQV